MMNQEKHVILILESNLKQQCKGNIALNNTAAADANNTNKKVNQTDDDGGINNVEIMAPLKYLSNFWRTLEMPLIN